MVMIHIRDRVRVLKGTDEFFNKKYIGCEGVVVARDVSECGTPKDPALIVRLDNSPTGETQDMFWPSELEIIE